jgi:hypothetical protein
MRKQAAETLATAVFKPTFKSLVDSMEFNKVKEPALAAVSPKRDRGPCSSAGSSPR